MESIELERVFRCVNVRSEIVARMFGDSREDPCARTAGRADD